MTHAQRRYVRGEAAIGAAISAVLSVAFTLLVFGGAAPVPVFGPHGLIVDAAPQSFMVALMATLVPTLLTRARARRGAVARLSGRTRAPRHPFALAVPVALAAAVLGTAATAILVVGPRDWPLGTVIVGKVLYGALLGGAVALLATITALRDNPR